MRYCSKCGTKLKDDQLYCPKCGNKEPFIKNSKQSSWKSFDIKDKKSDNVNYDFSSKTKTNPKNKAANNKALNILGLTFRIFEIVVGIIFIIFGVLTIIYRKNHEALLRSFSIASIVLASIAVLFVIALIVMVCVLKSWGESYRNAYLSSMIVALLVLGLSIIQLFIINDGFPVGILMGTFFVACNSLMSKVHSFKSFKKMAK